MQAPGVILVLRFSSIGDIVLTTSPLNRLRSAFPEARIDFMTLSEFSPMLEGHTAIDRLVCLDRGANLRELLQTARRLRSADYDLVVDLHNTLRGKIIRQQLNHIDNLVFKKPRWKRFLLFRFRKNTFASDFSVLNSMNQVLDPLVDKTEKPPDTSLIISDVEQNKAAEFLKENGINGNYITFIPGAAWPQKQWPAEKFALLAKRIHDQFALDIVILGTFKDQICDAIEKECGFIHNFKGLTSLRESMAILSLSELTIGNDTGMTHIAEALGKNVIMILGPTSRETGAGANRPGSATVEVKLNCRPCSQNGKRPCYRKEQYCLNEISADQVLDQAKRIIAAC